MFSRALRPSEVTGIRWEDIDFRSGTLTIAHSLEWVRGENGQPGRFHLKGTKTADSAEVLTLSEPELDLLLARQLQQKKDKLKAGADWQGAKWDLVFTTRSGRPLHHRDIYRPFQRLLKASGFSGHARMYDMRHGGISKVAVDFDLKTAQVFARHKQFSTTADIYAHVSDRRKAEVGRAMGSLVLAPSAS